MDYTGHAEVNLIHISGKAAQLAPYASWDLYLTAEQYRAIHDQVFNDYPDSLRHSSPTGLASWRIRADHELGAGLLVTKLLALAAAPHDVSDTVYPYKLSQQGSLVCLLTPTASSSKKLHYALNTLAASRLSGFFINSGLAARTWGDVSSCELAFHRVIKGLKSLRKSPDSILVASLQYGEDHGTPHIHVFSQEAMSPSDVITVVVKATGWSVATQGTEKPRVLMERARSTEAVTRYTLRSSKLHPWQHCRTVAEKSKGNVPTSEPVVEPTEELAKGSEDYLADEYSSKASDSEDQNAPDQKTLILNTSPLDTVSSLIREECAKPFTTDKKSY